MPIRLDARAPDFAGRFSAFLDTKREAASDVEAAVRAILADVAGRGDQALIELTRKFDRVDIEAAGLKVTAAEIEIAYGACDRRALDALAFARERIEAYHRRQLPRDERFTDALGVELGHRWTAIEAVGLYVPGGTAAYPSSVLMNAVPAKVAGVPRIVMVVPAPEGRLNPLVLAAARLAGIDEVYRVGGAQAVAALAYGTATIKAVAKIVGPGNAYVAAAKRLVFGRVGIDMIAGPSEVLILADASGQADWIAADLLAQAEHDASAQSILITDDAALAYGTATIAPVAKIVGPGNAYVAAAKRQVFGKVGIDMIAGPSEVLVISDHTGNAGWIAADLLAQAEHDVNAQSILITDSASLADEVERAVQSQLATLPRADIARASWNDFGAVILVKQLDEAVGLADAIAAEHLEIMTADPEGLAAKIRNAGAIFIGPHTPEAIGDYVGGSNHVLPTARSARFSSGLGVLDFMKRTSILKCGPDQLRALGGAAMALGKAEGLDAHARSVGLRLNLT